MAYTTYADILDPEVLMATIGENWLYGANLINSGIIGVDSLPLKGTLTSEIRQKVLQNRTGQALNPGDTISGAKREQEKASMPVLWRYDRIEEPDPIEEIIDTEIPQINADFAGEIQRASIQYVDDSFVKIIEGIGAALTANQYDGSGSEISLAAIAATKTKVGDKVRNLDGGAMVVSSAKYWKLVSLGLVAATSNTFGNMAQDMMVREGTLPVTVVGFTPVVTDKLAAAPASDYYTYLVGRNQVVARGGVRPIIKINEIDGKFSTEIKFYVRYGLGCSGMKWGASASAKVTDTDLSTSTNWSLATNCNSNDVTIFRMRTD